MATCSALGLLFRGDEGDDAPRDGLVHKMRRATVNRVEGLFGTHRQQAIARPRQRRNRAAPAFEFGEEVLAKADQQLVAAAAQVEVPGSPRIVLKLAGEMFGNAIFGKVSERQAESIDHFLG